MKKVSIKEFEKAKLLHEEILELEKEIKEIDKLAFEASEDKCKLSFNVKVDNYSKTEEKTEYNEPEENHGYTSMFSWLGGVGTADSNKNNNVQPMNINSLLLIQNVLMF